MSLTALIQEYGYYAVFAGTFLEGEAILVMAGFAAHRGYLELPWVVALATLGSFAGDQLYFFLGRHYGPRLLRRFPRLAPRAERVHVLLARHDLPLILGARFLYGLRTVGPMAIGMSRVAWIRFLALNLIGALAWAVLVAGAGYLLGSALELVLADLRRFEEALLVLIAVAGVVIWLSYRWRHRRTS